MAAPARIRWHAVCIDAAMHVKRIMAEEDARPVEGILAGVGLGAVAWTLLMYVAAAALV